MSTKESRAEIQCREQFNDERMLIGDVFRYRKIAADLAREVDALELANTQLQGALARRLDDYEAMRIRAEKAEAELAEVKNDAVRLEAEAAAAACWAAWAEEELADLEKREVVLPKPRTADQPNSFGWNLAIYACEDALKQAGIAVKEEG